MKKITEVAVGATMVGLAGLAFGGALGASLGHAWSNEAGRLAAEDEVKIEQSNEQLVVDVQRLMEIKAQIGETCVTAILPFANRNIFPALSDMDVTDIVMADTDQPCSTDKVVAQTNVRAFRDQNSVIHDELIHNSNLENEIHRLRKDEENSTRVAFMFFGALGAVSGALLGGMYASGSEADPLMAVTHK